MYIQYKSINILIFYFTSYNARFLKVCLRLFSEKFFLWNGNVVYVFLNCCNVKMCHCINCKFELVHILDECENWDRIELCNDLHIDDKETVYLFVHENLLMLDLSNMFLFDVFSDIAMSYILFRKIRRDISVYLLLEVDHSLKQYKIIFIIK